MATSPMEKVTNNSGSNYCKMPDGTLICYGQFNASFDNWTNWVSETLKTASTSLNVIFPIPFIVSPYISLVPVRDVWQILLQVDYNANGINSMTVARPSLNGNPQQWRWIAIGRWK